MVPVNPIGINIMSLEQASCRCMCASGWSAELTWGSNNSASGCGHNCIEGNTENNEANWLAAHTANNPKA